MRLILGLDYPNAGTVTIDGKRYASLANPMREVGALLDAKAVHGGRSAYNHLLCLAQTNNLPKRRVGEVLELVGLTDVARKRTKGFSLGMSQRLGIAATLLGDPKILMFDEPVNGLDPEGILWIRNFMKSLAAEGRTAFEHGVRLHELTVVRASLEAAFMELTADSVEYRGGENAQGQPAPVRQSAQEQLVAQAQHGSEGGI